MKKCFISLALMFLFLFAQTAAADLVANGGFETGDFSGWTRSGNPDNTMVWHWYPHSGSYAAGLGPSFTLGFITQSLSTAPGQAYDLRFWLQTGTVTNSSNEFEVIWGGNTIFHQVDISPQPYTLYDFGVIASGAPTDLTFGFRNDYGYSDMWLDDVSVNAVPLPGTLLLLSSGLLGLAGWRIRKR